MKTRCFNAAILAVLLLVAGDEAATYAVAGIEEAALPAAEPASTGAPVSTRAGEVVRKASPAPITESSANWDAVQVVVYKSKRSIALYRSGNFDREYPVVLGLQPEGRKRHANDARTPEGLYHVVGKRRHARWQYFLALDYPNAEDRTLYGEEVRKGTIPDENGRPFAIGGQLGIHGNDREVMQAAGIDWTKGCVALDSADIVELASIVPVGASVWIVE